MTEVRSKRRAFYPVIFTSICFRKPLLNSIYGIKNVNNNNSAVNLKYVKDKL